MRLQEVTLFENKTHRILNEGYTVLNEEQKAHVDRYQKELWPLLEELTTLLEQNLTPQQIQAIFKSAEEVAMDSGANRTALGKAGDAAAKGVDALKKTPEVYKKVQDKLKELQAAVKDSGPVKNADATFNNLKNKISAENPDSEIVKGVQAVSDWAKENPGKATIAVGILTAVAAFISGPVGGAAAGLILRSTKGMLQGEDLSTAVGKSAKAAAFGAAVGFLGDEIGDWFSGDEELATVKGEVDSDDIANAGGNSREFIPSFDSNEEYLDYFARKIYEERLEDLPGGGEFDLEVLERIKDNINLEGDVTEGSVKASVDGGFIRDKWLTVDELREYQQIVRANDPMGGMSEPAREYVQSLYPDADVDAVAKEPPTPAQLAARKAAGITDSLNLEYERYLAEGPFGNIASKAAGLMKKGTDAATKGARAAGGAIKKGAAKAADVAGDAADYAMDKTAPLRKELGNKVTQKKLQQTWTDLGEPTDVASIYDILSKAGMDADLIQAVSVKSDVKLEKPKGKDAAAPEVDLKKLAAEIKKAGVADAVKQQLAGAAKDTPGRSQADKAAFQQRADRARSMKAKPVR